MTPTQRRLEDIERVGNAACFDFVNTIHSRGNPEPEDYLQSYQDLVKWAALGGIINEKTRRLLNRRARENPRAATAALHRVRTLRETLYRVFSSIAQNRTPDRKDMAALNEDLGQALAHRRVGPPGHGCRWIWDDDESFERPLWPILFSAGEQLTSGAYERIRVCPGPDGCGWIFLDTSKNGSRRWCSMRTCGNVAKARRYYRKQTATS